jgi:hypothetical protein
MAAVFVLADVSSSADPWRTKRTYLQPKNKIRGGYRGGKVRNGREFYRPPPPSPGPQRRRGRPRTRPIENEGTLISSSERHRLTEKRIGAVFEKAQRQRPLSTYSDFQK